MINLPDDISVHVFKGVKLMDIYDQTTGFPRLDNMLRTDGADRDGDCTDVGLDIEWARNRNRDIVDEVNELREQMVVLNKEFTSHAIEIEKLLKERDDITYKFRLAGRAFNDKYEDKFSVEREKLLVDSTIVQEGSEFNRITKEMNELYSQKNTDYGDAFAQSLDEDGLLVSKIRLKDKLNRFAQLIENDALVNDESMRDTLIDMANYAVMTMMWLDANE